MEAMEDNDPEGIMSEHHKDALRKARTKLVDNMTPGRVVTMLYAEGIISGEDQDTILAERTRYAQNRALLDVLSRRPEKAFLAFRDALTASEQAHLATALADDPTAGQKRPRTTCANSGATTSRGLPVTTADSSATTTSKGLPVTSPEQEEPRAKKPTPMEQCDVTDAFDVPASEPITRNPVNIPAEPVNWERYENRGMSRVKPTSRDTFSSLLQELASDKIYSMQKARKGKACIIKLHKFEVPWLSPLPGYDADEESICELWDSIGFDVLLPRSSVESRCLTANELRVAVEHFSGELSEDDQAAVLCILSHGGDRTVYGADGKPVNVMELTNNLNHVNCSQMARKPKIVIIQSCQGEIKDCGVKVRDDIASPNNPDFMPTLSDVFFAFPTMPGYQSFVNPSSGSLFIRTFVDVMSKNSCSSHMADIFTEVCRDTSEDVASTEGDDGLTSGGKQQPHSLTCLRKKLYFLPCDGGKDGEDWC